MLELPNLLSLQVSPSPHVSPFQPISSATGLCIAASHPSRLLGWSAQSRALSSPTCMLDKLNNASPIRTKVAAQPTLQHVTNDQPQLVATPAPQAAGARCVPADCDRIKLHTPEGKPKELLTCERCQLSPTWHPVSGQVPGKRPASAAASISAASDSCSGQAAAPHPCLEAARRYAAGTELYRVGKETWRCSSGWAGL